MPEELGIPQATGHAGEAAAGVQLAEQPTLNLELVPHASAPSYAQFVLFGLTAALAISVIAFNIADDSERGGWESTPSTVMAMLCCFALCTLTLRAWDRLGKTTDAAGSIRKNKLAIRILVFSLLFIATAAMLGFAIGKSGGETNQFIADSQAAGNVANRISTARESAPRTVPGQIEMYKSIEPDVNQWGVLLKRVRAEVDIYAAKYPAQGDSDTRRSLDIGLQRIELLHKQIEVAREIDGLDATAQWNAWGAEMEPLLERERALNHD